MNLGFYIIVGLWIATVALIAIRRKTIEKNWLELRQKQLEKQAKTEEKEILLRIQQKEEEAHKIEQDIKGRKIVLGAIDENINSLTVQRDTIQRSLETYEAEGKAKADKYVEDVKQEKLKLLEEQIRQEGLAMTKEAQIKYNEQIQALANARDAAQDEVNQIAINLEAYRAKQEAINQEILRRRELEEKTDFYRVCLSEDAISDIILLKSIRQNLKKQEILDKLIYENYVAKPVLEMIKRVLQNSTCSGIYKITCLATEEIYIGKSTDIKNRWQQHCKTAFNCGTIASSLLHTKMKQYGIENFTFELLETVPKDELSEREKYYIDFYKTKEVGLNERNG